MQRFVFALSLVLSGGVSCLGAMEDEAKAKDESALHRLTETSGAGACAAAAQVPDNPAAGGAGEASEVVACTAVVPYAHGAVTSEDSRVEDTPNYALFLNLPNDVWPHILSFLDPVSFRNASCVSRGFYRLSRETVRPHMRFFKLPLLQALPQVLPQAAAAAALPVEEDGSPEAPLSQEEMQTLPRCRKLTVTHLPHTPEQQIQFVQRMPRGVSVLDMSQADVWCPDLIPFLAALREAEKLPPTLVCSKQSFRLPAGERWQTAMGALLAFLKGTRVHLRVSVQNDDGIAVLHHAVPHQLGCVFLNEIDVRKVHAMLREQRAITQLSLLDVQGPVLPLIAEGCWDNVEDLSIDWSGRPEEEDRALYALPALRRLVGRPAFLSMTHPPAVWMKLNELELIDLEDERFLLSSCAQLAQGTNLRKLTLHSVLFSGDAWQDFVRACRLLKHLSTLSLAKVDLDDDIADRPAAIAALGQALSTVSLSHLSLNSSLFCEAPESFWQNALNPQTLRTLSLQKLQDPNNPRLFQGPHLVAPLRMCQGLTALSLFDVAHELPLVCAVAPHTPALRKLEIHQSEETRALSDPADWRRLFETLQGCQHLADLSLSHMEIPGDALVALGEVWRLNRLSHCTLKFLRPTPWGPEEGPHPLWAALSAMTHLQELNLRRCAFPYSAGLEFVRTLPRMPRLTNLFLRSVPLGHPVIEGCVQALANEASQCHPSVTLNYCQFRGQPILSGAEKRALKETAEGWFRLSLV